jgi:hypothetical protein
LGETVIGRLTVISAAVLFLVGCATETPPQPRWSKAGAGSEELSAARSDCMKQAQEPDLGVGQSRMQAEARGNIFMRCMREKGWEQVPGEANE